MSTVNSTNHRRNTKYGRMQQVGKQQYVGGSAAPKNIVEEMNKPYKPVNARVAKNRAKTKRMSFGYVLFLSLAVAVTGIMLISYLKAQSELTVSVKRVASLEKQLNTLKLTNDEEIERIESNVNLEEIKKIAVEELGMTYAKAGQVVTISDEGSDYVRQLGELPEN